MASARPRFNRKVITWPALAEAKRVESHKCRWRARGQRQRNFEPERFSREVNDQFENNSTRAYFQRMRERSCCSIEMTWCWAKMELRRLGSKGKIRLVAAISHTLTRLALLLRGDEVDNLRFRLHLPNDLADLFLRQLGLGEPDEVERASHV
jgi:hypothetical protein